MFLLKTVVVVALLTGVLLHDLDKKEESDKNVVSQTIHQANAGKWKSVVQSKQGLLPQYFICGAEMTYFRLSSASSCSITTKPFTAPVSVTCVGGKPLWQRSNGIKFKYCNFEDWSDQKSNLYYGSWEWQGMKMCPRNQYVFSYSTRISQIQGLNGLTIRCKDRYTNDQSNVTVKQGKGTIKISQLKDPKLFQFAYDYAIKYQDEGDFSYITGLNLIYTPFPQIVKMEILYDTIPLPQIRIQHQIRDINIENRQQADLTISKDPNIIVKEMLASKLNRDKQTFTFILFNNQNKFHGDLIQKYMSQNYDPLQLLLPKIITKQQQLDIQLDRMVKFKMQRLQNNFEFGRKFVQSIPTYNFLKYTVPKCNRLEMRSVIYSAMINNPYTLTVTYQSGKQFFTQKIRGYYQGTIISRPEIYADYFYIC